MKKVIIIIAYSLLPSITLAVNDTDKPNDLPTNEAQKTYTNNIGVVDENKPNSKIQKLLHPNDIVITMASVGMDPAVPYPRFPPRPFHTYPFFAQGQSKFPLPFKYKAVGIISALGSGITKYKIGDMISIEKLNANNHLNDAPYPNLDDPENSFFSYKYNENNKDIMPSSEEFPD